MRRAPAPPTARLLAPALALPVALVLAAGCSGGQEAPEPAPSAATPSSAAPTATAPSTTAPTATAPTTAAPTAAAPTATAPTGGAAPRPLAPEQTDAATAPVPAPPSATGVPGAPATAPADEPAVGGQTLPPVSGRQEAALSDGVAVSVRDVREAQVEAREPGDVSGPAAVVRVRARNGGAGPADLSGVAVTASTAGAPASPSAGEPAAPLAGALAPGAEAEGTYVFRLPPGSSLADLEVQVGSGSSTTVVVVEP